MKPHLGTNNAFPLSLLVMLASQANKKNKSDNFRMIRTQIINKTLRKQHISTIMSNNNCHINFLLDSIDHDEYEAKALAKLQPVTFNILIPTLQYVMYLKEDVKKQKKKTLP